MYYKLGQVLQIRAVITNWGITNDTTGKTRKELTDQGMSLWKNEGKGNVYF